MLLAVAGLSDDDLKAKVKVLAGKDWATLPAHERLAFRFAAKLTRTADKVTKDDVAELAGAFGPERAVDLIWYTCWCNYMTRVADGFQLPLEKENPFGPPPEKKEKKKLD
jgi:alkylhydroperoxidase family enzyme